MEKFKNFCLNWLSIPILLCGFYLMCANFNVSSIMIFILGAVMTTKRIIDYGYKQYDIGMLVERFGNKYKKEMYNHGHNNEDTFTISLPLEYDIILTTIRYAKFVCDKTMYIISDINRTNEKHSINFY